MNVGRYPREQKWGLHPIVRNLSSHILQLTMGIRSLETALERIRQTLVQSHVAVISIALLLLFSLDTTFRALWPPVQGILGYVFTTVAILDIPYWSSAPGVEGINLVLIAVYLYSAVVELGAAWLISRWLFGVGPIRCLQEHRRRYFGRRDA